LNKLEAMNHSLKT